VLELESLLQMLHNREANELRLVSGQSPHLIVGNQSSRIALPPVEAGWLRNLVGGLLGPDRLAALESTGLVGFAQAVGDLGMFDMQVQGTIDEPVLLVRPQIDRTAMTIDPAMAVAGPEAGLQAPPALREALAQAVARGASDIHLGDGDPPMVRIAGLLAPLVECQVANVPIRPLVETMLTSVGRRRLADGAAVDFSFSVDGVGRFRGNAYRAVKGYNLAIRVLPQDIPTLQELRLPRSLTELTEFTNGLVLVCGPTGSGKSATVAALLGHINERRPIHIITLEDPIEFVYTRKTAMVRQREVGVHVNSFAEGLRDALREDPDVILVGEMRDLETISLALTAAETGHLVLSTMHSNRASTACERIVDVFPEHQQSQVRLQLAESLRAVVAQRLLPEANDQGRIAALEVLRVNHAVANNIREQRVNQIPSVMQTHREQGMWVLERHLAALAKKGMITAETARAHAGDAQLLQTYMTA
jgi:twitching motility protein PilT